MDDVSAGGAEANPDLSGRWGRRWGRPLGFCADRNRLVKELRLRGVCTANACPETEYESRRAGRVGLGLCGYGPLAG